MARKVVRKRSQINATINKELHEEIRNLSLETDIPISKLLDKAIEMLLNEMVEKQGYVRISKN
ncbi:ribbon-helix-helix domain-containing protein [Alkalihalophilus pseudofirmus]|uniref:ribbon-helix-helix domain-containing protein n=1 Tax=Alkalihalophilus pseudofirmus TaxID=79885 RepID=UPI00259B176E|nr:ribbon-helix-helix domain-containing protein [Alkalihalophilus pseudofirmus]WEG18493.1 ribbon-helix-helix domain-containing protein [Alkalihalophilus pseudofirmus]